MNTKRESLISKGWMQAVAIVGLCGFLLLGVLAYVPRGPALNKTSFCFDIGGVLHPDKLTPDNAFNVFRELGER